MVNLDLKPHTKRLLDNGRWQLVGIVLLSIILRAWGIDFGLPYIYHPDESVGVTIAQNMFKTGDLNPHFFHWPSLIFYINAAAYGPYYLVGKLAGIFQSPVDIPGPVLNAMASGWTPMATTYMLGRMVTALFGIAAVVMVFLIGRDLTNDRRVGLLAALFTSISPTHVSNSRYIAPDTLSVFFVLLSLWGSIQVFREGKTRHYLIAGLAAGFSASTKYNGALVILVLVLAHFIRHRTRGFGKRDLYLAVVLSAVAFFITTPFALLGFKEFWAALQFDAQHYASGHPGMEGDTLNWYLTYLWQTEGPVSLLAVLGILWGVRTRRKQIALLAAFPLTYFVFISRFIVRNDRTILLLIPFLFLMASILLIDWYKQARMARAKLLAVAVCGILVLSLAVPLVKTARRGIRISSVDSRETARIWIAENLTDGARVAVESYAPYVDPQDFSVQGFSNGLIEHDPMWYVGHNFDYLVFSEGAFGRFFSDPIQYSDQVSQYQALFQAFKLVALFTDGGYEVRIYRIAE